VELLVNFVFSPSSSLHRSTLTSVIFDDDDDDDNDDMTMDRDATRTPMITLLIMIMKHYHKVFASTRLDICLSCQERMHRIKD